MQLPVLCPEVMHTMLICCIVEIDHLTLLKTEIKHLQSGDINLKKKSYISRNHNDCKRSPRLRTKNLNGKVLVHVTKKHLSN